MSKEVVFLINRSEIVAGTRGASLGPDAIFAAARKNDKSIFSDYSIQEIKDVNRLLDLKTDHQYAKRIDGLLEIYTQLNEKVAQLLLKNKFPLLLAADHGSAGGTIAGIKYAFPDKKIGVIWIDAHADIHTPYTTTSGNLHGMPLATALNEDNLICRKNEVPESTKAFWDKLKQIGGTFPKITPDNLIYIGVRDTQKEENSIIERLNIKQYGVEAIRSNGVESIMNSIQSQLNGCDVLYVSFDVDSMDPDITSYGTGTPVKNGLTPDEAKEILTFLASDKKTVCMEFVEINPCLDNKKNVMAEITLDLIEAVLKELK